MIRILNNNAIHDNSTNKEILNASEQDRISFSNNYCKKIIENVINLCNVYSENIVDFDMFYIKSVYKIICKKKYTESISSIVLKLEQLYLNIQNKNTHIYSLHHIDKAYHQYLFTKIKGTINTLPKYLWNINELEYTITKHILKKAKKLKHNIIINQLISSGSIGFFENAINIFSVFKVTNEIELNLRKKARKIIENNERKIIENKKEQRKTKKI